MAKDSQSTRFAAAGALALGAGAAALAPAALRRLLDGSSVGEIVPSPGEALGNLGSKLGHSLADRLGERVDEAGGPAGILKDALPFGGDDDDEQPQSSGGVPGVGKGRRMPVQQSVDIGVPLEAVYNQFTQFEQWPTFMHRVTRVTQEDECTLGFAVKIWGKTKEFTANIETQRPDERIKWTVSQGMAHTGVVTFHELGPRLTRVLVGMDLDPGGPLEKAARGLRYLKRAVRADLHRFKALIEMSELETGAWRGVIEDGEVVQEHDESYDEEREYAEASEILGQAPESDSSAEDEGEEPGDDGDPEAEGEEPEDDDEPEAEGEEPEPAESGSRRGRASGAARRPRGENGASASRGRSAGGSERRSSSGHGQRRRSGSPRQASRG